MVCASPPFNHAGTKWPTIRNVIFRPAAAPPGYRQMSHNQGQGEALKHMVSVWRPLNRPEFGVVDSISESVRKEERLDPHLLVSVSRGPTLAVVSDYAGDNSTFGFHSYSFLLADLAFAWYWDEVRRALRRSVLKDGRRLSYKKLQSDENRARCLVPFLRAANSIPGLLITLLVDKRVKSLFKPDLDLGFPEAVPRNRWRAAQFEKLMRIAHFSALLISGLVGDQQRVLWVSDQDEIVPNNDRHIDACKLFGHVLGHYLNCDVGRCQFATTRGDDGSLVLEDLATLPDLSAGALAELVSWMAKAGCLASTSVLAPMSQDISMKARALVNWLADGRFTLKKLAFVIEHGPGDAVVLKRLRLFPEELTPEYDFRSDLEHYVRTGRV